MGWGKEAGFGGQAGLAPTAVGMGASPLNSPRFGSLIWELKITGAAASLGLRKTE